VYRLVLRVFALSTAALGLAVCTPSAGARDIESDAHPRRTERIGNSVLEISIQPGRLALDDAALAHLLGDSARAIASYYGQLPFERARLVVTPSDRDGIHGNTRCARGALVRLDIGPRVNAEDIRNDWVITHELLHVAFTSIDDENKYAWIGEGLSSYLEPLVRVRAGTLTEAELWRDLLRGAAQGLPGPGDQGLDRTHSWGRTYWGGALYWLEVDLTIRDQTHGQRGLKDALRAVAAAGANVCTNMTLDRMIATADAGTGTHALAEVHARRGLSNAAPDLDAWWQKLGVALRAGKVVFDDAAPWAKMRASMTRD
jgi:hypothetical protein